MEDKQRYTIGAVQQNRLLELALDIKDAYILTYLRDIIGGSNKIISKVVDGEVYYWIKYENIIKYLPILKIDNLKVISRRLAKYEELGLIKRHVHRPFNQFQGTFKGAYTFISLTAEFSSLFEISKLDNDEEEMERAAIEMGLSVESPRNAGLHHENLKVPMVSHHGNSKVPTIEGTQKFSHNTPNNNTPNNKKATAIQDTVNKIDPVSSQQKKISSSSCYEFLNNFELDTGTKENIIKLIPNLTEEKFSLVYSEILKRFQEGKIKNFSAVLFTALKDNWDIKPPAPTVDTEKEERQVKGTCGYYIDFYKCCGGSVETLLKKFENDLQHIKNKDLVTRYKNKLLQTVRKEE